MNLFGCLPQPPDERDYKALARLPAIEILPPYVDLRSFAPPVRNQGALGACVAFACTSLREFMVRRQVYHLSQDTRLIHLSPLYNYLKARQLMGDEFLGKDSGAYIRNGVKALAKFGCATELEWPYDPARFAEAPPDYAEAWADVFKIWAYSSINTLAEMKLALAHGFGFVMAVKIFDNVFNGLFPLPLPGGFLPLPTPSSVLISLHALAFYGYRDDPDVAGGGYFMFPNSWGREWGLNGWGFLPYQYVLEGHTQDAWMVEA